MQLIGYKMRGQDLLSIQTTIDEMKKRSLIKLKQYYQQLLRDEIESIFDETALSMIERADISILAAAQRSLNEKIYRASSLNCSTFYNFLISAHLFPFEGDSYFQIHANGKWMLENSFSNISGFRPYHVRSAADVELEIGQCWQKIMKHGEEHEPLGVTVFRPETILEFDVKKMMGFMKFHSRSERAKVRARHQVMNSILGNISGGNIPNYKLMPYMDLVIECLQEDHAKEQIQEAESRLLQILPEIKQEDILRDPMQTPKKEDHNEKK